MAEAVLQVKVVPGASRSRVAGRYGEGVKVQVSAAPEKGKANDAVLEILAQWLGVKPAQLTLRSGQTNPRKQILVSGLSAQELQQRIASLAE